MHKKLIQLFCFLFLSNYAEASELYTEQFSLSNKTPYLKITVPPKNREMIPSGPSDATVIDNTFVILDTWNSGLAFFDKQGNFLKRISLPKETHFERIVRDQDNSLFVFGALENYNSNQTMVVHIQNGVITEKSILPITEYLIKNIISDDYGLFMKREEEHLDRQKLAETSEEDFDKVMDNMSVRIEDRISRNCISCEPKPANGVSVNGLLYHINEETNQPLAIDKQEVPLSFYPNQNNYFSKIIQIDKDGVAWIENSVIFGDYQAVVHYVWKINKFGKVVALYRFASDKEDYGTIWPVKHDVIISNDGAVYGMVSNRKQLKFRRLKASSLKEMQGLAKELDSSLILKKHASKKKPLMKNLLN